MTPCPICRGRADPGCMCENGYIAAEWMDSRPATRGESTLFWGVTVVCLVPWALAAWFL